MQSNLAYESINKSGARRKKRNFKRKTLFVRARQKTAYEREAKATAEFIITDWRSEQSMRFIHIGFARQNNKTIAHRTVFFS